MPGQKKKKATARERTTATSKAALITSDSEEEAYSICQTCNEEVSEDDAALQCEVCRYWFHCECQEISLALYKELNTDSTGNALFAFSCTNCKKGCSKLMQHIKRLTIQQQNHDEKITVLENQNKEMKEELKMEKTRRETELVTVNERLQTLEEKPDGQGADRVIQEMEERKYREGQVVLFNVPSSQATDPETRKAEDLERIRAVCKKVVPSYNLQEPQSLFRFGAKKPGKHRPLKMRFADATMAKELITKWREVPIGRRKEQSPIIVIQDTTPEQRNYQKNLQEERDRRQEELVTSGEMDTMWKIVRGRLRKVRVTEEGKK